MPLGKAKKTNKSLLSWNSGANLASNVGTYNFLKSNGMTSSLATENSAKIVITEPSILTNLTVILAGDSASDPSPGTGKSRKFVVRKNNNPTDLSVTISDLNTTGNNDSVQLEVNKYDTISLVHFTETGVSNNAIGIVSANQISKN